MWWDRFDIVEAYWLYFAHNHEGQWSHHYRRLSRIARYFRPRLGLRDVQDLSENGQAIYRNLEERENIRVAQ